MFSVVNKRWKIYCREKFDFISMLVRPIFFLLPYYFFLIYDKQTPENVSFIMISGLCTHVIINIVVGANYEIYKEVGNLQFLNIVRSKLLFSHYILANIIFWQIITAVQFTLVLFTFNLFGIISIDSIISLLIIAGIFILMCLSSVILVFLLVGLTIKINNFQYSSFITDFLLIMSGSFFSVLLYTNDFLRLCALLSPFTYILELIRFVLSDSVMSFPLWTELSLLFLTLIIWSFVATLVYKKIISKKIREVE